jgi:hypothetical protein
MHILEYVNDLNPVPINFIVDMAFEPIKLQLKRDLKKYENTKEFKSNGGKIGNLKRWNKDLYDKVLSKEITLEDAEKIAERRKASHTDVERSHRVAEIAVNDTVTVNVNDTVTVNDISLKENSISKNEIFGKEVLASPSWIETISMQNRITPSEVPTWISEFNKKLISELDTKISKKEYASHFSRWLPQEILKSKKTTDKDKPFTTNRG